MGSLDGNQAFGFDSAPLAWQGSRRTLRYLRRDLRPIRSQERSALASPELGAKQICPSCGAKFYDLGRRPAVCPKCQTAFDPEEAVKSRRVRARSVAPDYETEDEVAEKPAVEAEVEGFEDEVDETPEIDQAVEAEPLETEDGDVVVEPPSEPDLGVDFEEEVALEDDAEDVPFLEDDDEEFPDDDLDVLPEDDEDAV
jgi:uncharacterized protein (TIGR02300 family)